MYFSVIFWWSLCKKNLGGKSKVMAFFFKTISRAVLWFESNFPITISFKYSSVLPLSHVRLFVIPWTAAHQASRSFTTSQSLLKLRSIKSLMPSNHLVLCHPLLLLLSIFPSIRVFSNKSVLHIRWPKYWSFSFSISSSNEDSGLISFRMDWLDLLAVDLGWTNAHSVAKPSHAATKRAHSHQMTYPRMFTASYS